jgi:hypothetical protein
VSKKTKRAKVVSLRGGEIIPPGEPRPNVIALAEQILERAKSGDLMGLSAVLYHSDDTHSMRSEGRVTYATVGTFERLKHLLLRDMD